MLHCQQIVYSTYAECKFYSMQPHMRLFCISNFIISHILSKLFSMYRVQRFCFLYNYGGQEKNGTHKYLGKISLCGMTISNLFRSFKTKFGFQLLHRIISKYILKHIILLKSFLKVLKLQCHLSQGYNLYSFINSLLICQIEL